MNIDIIIKSLFLSQYYTILKLFHLFLVIVSRYLRTFKVLKSKTFLKKLFLQKYRLRGNPFSTYAKLSEKLTFFTP